MKPNKIFDFYNNEKIGEDPSMDLHDENQIKAIIRLNCAMAPYTTNFDLQKHRSYMMVENIKKMKIKKLKSMDILGVIHLYLENIYILLDLEIIK